MKVLIITGGNSSERKISFMSARKVEKALLYNNHLVKLYDLNKGYQPLRGLSKKFDILFPVLHGEEGEGGKLHQFLAMQNKPVVGTKNYQGMQKAWYKIPFKIYCDKNNIPTPPWKLVKNIKDILSFGFPCVVKTSSGGSSREVFILKSENELKKYKNKIFKLADLFVEKYIGGTEVTVGILKDKALPVLEIIPPKGNWFDFKNKYSGQTQEILDAPSLSAQLKKELGETALSLHRHFDLGSYSRVDFIVNGNKIFVLELNTIPGLTENSLLPKETGMPFESFIEILVTSAA